LKASYAALKVA
jgi:phage shock protein A